MLTKLIRPLCSGLLASCVLAHGQAWAQWCHADASVATYKPGDLETNFRDYGVLFHDAQDVYCYQNAATWLAAKIQDELDAASPGFRGFLGGGDAYLAMATGLILGGRGPWALDAATRSRLDGLLQRVADPMDRGGYRFDPVLDTQCNAAAKSRGSPSRPAASDNTCMEEYATAAAAHAWIAAYQIKNGRSPGDHVGQAHANLHDSFSLTDSACVHAKGSPAGLECTTCVTAISDGDLYNGILNDGIDVLSYNGLGFTSAGRPAGENPNYGAGILTSLAAAVTALQVAGENRYPNPYDWWPNLGEIVLAQGLVRQAQKRIERDWGAPCAVNWTQSCYDPNVPVTPNVGLVCTNDVDCADPGKVEPGQTRGLYRPAFYPIRSFLNSKFSFPDRRQPLMLDGLFSFDACPTGFPDDSFSNPRGFLGDARLAVYRDLAWNWFEGRRPALAGLNVDVTPPQIWVDVPQHYQTVRDSTNFYGWAIDAVSGVSVSFTIDGRPLYGIGYGGTRPDVCATLGITKDPACSVGWGGFVDTTAFGNGPHTLYVTATDASGNTQTYARVFVVDNPSLGYCSASPPVGPSNIYAYYAGIYDYYCGYYKYYYGYDYGYCAQAVSYASTAGVNTAATGTCAYGTIYNYYAGLYDYYCRYYEYAGYGWDYASYCYWSSYYASAGGCTGCGTTQPQQPPCQGTARTIWIQPQWRAGFGPPGSLTVAGSATSTGFCSSGGVDLYWRFPGGWWQHVPYSAPVGSDGIWYNSIENADPFATYETYVTYHNGAASYCTYDGRNDIVWCP
jgi:hypothetical protein